MTAQQQHGMATCRVCRRETQHERINAVTRGQTYVRCCVCSTVIHFPTPAEERPT